ncbi:hypothetical protein [uncultured Mycolicibacterium sp.]|uniref:hypothetical protein n=1 Tax=uncultured Mycolicibacterium sp. TaxID=2320817 RepID=UPI002631619E|nr:hypothetical protein [uncultured Mycolicibacterium sp.]
MRIRVTRYVTVEVNDRLRWRLRQIGEHLRAGLTARLRSAADDVETAGDRVARLCDAAVTRVDAAVAGVTDRIAPAPDAPADASASPRSGRHLRAV